jgi:alkylmercury lyase
VIFRFFSVIVKGVGQMVKTHLAQVVDSLTAIGLRDMFPPEVSRFVVQLLGRVAEGQPVTLAEAQALASRLEVSPDVADKVIQQMCERDNAGNIIGLVGLSQNSYGHKFQVNGQRLSTWCALDALFLPMLLQQTAEVNDQCPVTKTPISLTITPDGVATYQPDSAVVSAVTPQVQAADLSSVREIWMTFCNHIHFFRSRDAAQQWFSGKSQEFQILSVEDGFTLGRILFGGMVEQAKV